MENMELYLDMSEPDTPGGVIFVTIGDICFPEESWYDLAQYDLEQWIPGIISFAKDHTDSCILQFMDGPYCVKLSRCESGRVYVVCARDHEIQIPQTQIDFGCFLKSIVKCIGKYNHMQFQKGEKCRFESEYRELRKAVKQLS